MTREPGFSGRGCVRAAEGAEVPAAGQDAPSAKKLAVAVEREAVVRVARTWLGTPYHHAGRIKGVGADCLTLLAEVYAEAGVIAPVPPIEHYPPDWHLHRSQERYLEGLMRYAREIPAPPLPGDLAIYKFGRCWSHGAIVVEWPMCIHAYLLDGVVLVEGDNGKLADHEVRFFSPWRG